MSYKDITLKTEYRSPPNNVVRDFYIPVLKEAISYRRAVGFFSSSALAEIAVGLTGLFANGGKIQLVASPYLSEEDIDAITTGYKNREEIIRNSLLKSLKEPKNYYEKERLNLLANLVTSNQLDIRIALLEKNKTLGMYHEKMGIICDRDMNKIAFSGSMNESAMALNMNYESIDVFCSWSNEYDYKRVIAKEGAFQRIWNNEEPCVTVLEFPEIEKTLLEKYKRTNIDLTADIREAEEFDETISGTSVKEDDSFMVSLPREVKLYEYQNDAIEEWANQNYQGIFDMATGTGKTLTALAGLAKLYGHTEGKLAVVIVCPYQHLVEQWVDDIITFNIRPIIGYSSSIQKDWKKRLDNAIRDQKLGTSARKFFCFICTNATFSSDYVQQMMSRIRGNSLLIVDEAHNFGAANLSLTLKNNFIYRLALSATIKRFNDEEGTKKLLEYFGKTCIEYPLERAIREHKLTPYKYYPILVSLRETERKIYSELTYEIGKCFLKKRDGSVKLSDKGKRLALQRARLVAAAEEKVEKLREQILPYVKDNHILVYCGAANLLEFDQDTIEVQDDELRQIDVVTKMLGNDLNMKVSQFTSKENIQERMILKREFQKGENLQVLVAIKCLDEGVNIPAIKLAFILASTTNPKEYIQRRGRVLRIMKDKEYAEIYDFVTVPRPLDEVSSLTSEDIKKDLPLVINELPRVEEFGKISMNSMHADRFIQQIKDVYHLQNDQFEYEFE